MSLDVNKSDYNNSKCRCIVSLDTSLLNVPGPYTPQQIKKAYNFPDYYLGSGKTIGIVVAYGSPNTLSDLQTFCSKYSLPPANIEIAYPQGQSGEYPFNWSVETSIDTQWSHALAPYAKILLVVAKSEDNDDIYGAVDYAVNAGVDIVSMSWGDSEFLDEINYDYHFNVPNVAFVAASGDKSLPIYPSTSPYVLSIGGTSLQLDSEGNLIAPEIAWNGSGGGISYYERRPCWQTLYQYQFPENPTRATPDISLFSDPLPGVSIYVTYPDLLPDGSFIGAGGTSVATPCIAAILSGIRCNNYNCIQEKIYKLAQCSNYPKRTSPFYDIKIGSSGIFFAIYGYDYVTGIGSLNVSKFLKEMSSYRYNFSTCCTNPEPYVNK